MTSKKKKNAVSMRIIASLVGIDVHKLNRIRWSIRKDVIGFMIDIIIYSDSVGSRVLRIEKIRNLAIIYNKDLGLKLVQELESLGVIRKEPCNLVSMHGYDDNERLGYEEAKKTAEHLKRIECNGGLRIGEQIVENRRLIEKEIMASMRWLVELAVSDLSEDMYLRASVCENKLHGRNAVKCIKMLRLYTHMCYNYIVPLSCVEKVKRAMGLKADEMMRIIKMTSVLKIDMENGVMFCEKLRKQNRLSAVPEKKEMQKALKLYGADIIISFLNKSIDNGKDK